jgi:hypothetical protein
MDAPAWREKCGDEAAAPRDEVEQEFGKTARASNQRAREIGTEADYDERWGE